MFTKQANTEYEFIAQTHPSTDRPDGTYRLAVFERDANVPQLRKFKDFIVHADLDLLELLIEDIETAPVGTKIDLRVAAAQFATKQAA